MTQHHIRMALFAVILSLVILAFAIFLQKMGMAVLEEEHHFFLVVGLFFAAFIAGAIAIGFLATPIRSPSDIGELISSITNLSSTAIASE